MEAEIRTVSQKAVHQLQRIRLLVAALGERLPQPWWRSQFLTPTGVRYVERIFPRLPLAAALASVTLAARREHDANLAIQTYHLFRLPPHLEDLLSESVRDGALDANDLPDTVEALTKELEQIHVGDSPSTATGPKSLGKINELLSPDTLGRMASMYAAAAREQTRVYPYFETDGDE